MVRIFDSVRVFASNFRYDWGKISEKLMHLLRELELPEVKKDSKYLRGRTFEF